MVKALHRAGIEVILDVVYNHTAEGNETGPTLCYRGLADDLYYILEPDRASYSNYTGTGHERQRLSLNHLIRQANKAWHGVRLNQPDWSDHSRSVAFTVEIRQEGLLMHLSFNTYWEPLEFELPPAGSDGGNRWRRWIDTAQETPNEIVPWEEAPTVPGLAYQAEARSVVALYAPGS